MQFARKDSKKMNFKERHRIQPGIGQTPSAAD